MSNVTKIYSHSSPRVRRVAENEWQVARMEKFRESVRFAAAAKSYRTAMGITQREVADIYGFTSSTIARMESGCYFGWNEDRLKNYIRIVNRVAKGEYRRKSA